MTATGERSDGGRVGDEHGARDEQRMTGALEERSSTPAVERCSSAGV